jgi:hypothetical protein
MNDIYRKIDTIFAEELSDRPVWVDEILSEIRNLSQKVENQAQKQKKLDKDFFRFLKEFRAAMYADTQTNRYPKINYGNRVLGVNFDGLLYDIKSSNLLTTKEAFLVYGHLYKKKNLEIFH